MMGTPLFGLGYRTPTFQCTSEEFADISVDQQRRFAEIKLLVKAYTKTILRPGSR